MHAKHNDTISTFLENLPCFKTLDPKKQYQKIIDCISAHEKKYEILLNQKAATTWDNFFHVIEDMDNHLENLWSPLRHLNHVHSTETSRAAYAAAIEKIVDYQTKIGQNTKLLEKMQTFVNNPAYTKCTQTQQKIIQDHLLNFKLSGVALSPEKKLAFLALQQELSTLTTAFENNLLDATQAWELYIDDEKRLSGLPIHTQESAKNRAIEKNKAHTWCITLDAPTYLSVMVWADDRDLRKHCYEAYVTRASALGENPTQWDNSEIMVKILRCRQEMATLLGFENYAVLSLQTKMLKQVPTVFSFLEKLAVTFKPLAEKELKTLEAFAQQLGHTEKLAPWDILYFSEKQKQATFKLDSESIRAYFPCHKVLDTLFFVTTKLFSVTLKACDKITTWHPDVQCYLLYNKNENCLGLIYMDLFARDKKRGGAWMDECQSKHRRRDQYLQLPVAYLTCNFTPAGKSKKAYLNHDEILTLFHEFGHCLHHLLTEIDSISVAGINQVAWDAVELPSQLMENFAWDQRVLQQASEHEETAELLPDDIYTQLINSKNYQIGLHLMRQIEFALFDMQIHANKTIASPESIQTQLDTIRKQYSVVPIHPNNRFQHSFSHIFGGGYAAGYYSYLWAEILSCDVFALFATDGKLSQKIGEKFLKAFLSQGGSQESEILFKNLMGREAKLEAFMTAHGIGEHTQDPSKG